MRNYLIMIGLTILSLAFLYPYFQSGYFQTDDGVWAVVRQASMHNELRSAQFPVRWSGSLNFGYGYPLFQFSYPAPYYFGELFHLLGFGLVDSVKAVFIVSTVLSILLMYIFARNLWKNEFAGLIAALLYLGAPYRSINLYYRGSVGETMAFFVFPLLCFFGLELLQTGKRRYLIGGAGALALLIMTHNVMALIFLPFFIYFLITETILRNVKLLMLFRDYLDDLKNKKSGYKKGYAMSLLYKHIGPVILMVAIGIALSATFWLPAISELQYVKLGTQSLTSITREFQKQEGLLLTPLDGSDNKKDNHTVVEENLEFEYLVYALTAIAMLLFYKNKYEVALQRILLYSIPLFIGLLLLTPASIGAWKSLPGLRSIDFPWRLLGLLSFISPIIISSVSLLPRGRYLGVMASVLSLILVLPLVSVPKTIAMPDSYYATNQATTTSANEYLSKWVQSPLSESAKGLMLADQNSVSSFLYTTKKNTSTVKEYQYSVEAPTRAILPIMYFPGWEVNLDGQKTAFTFNQSNGLISTELKAGKHLLTATFNRTIPRMLGDIITLASLIGIGILFIIEYTRGKRFVL